ncbi:MAG TPA: LysR family transcriptional regulator [Azospirillum sp.]|nr:LysR family transcriptional regulator [Azospirillum sp.]
MDWDNVRCFLAIARTGSLTEGAGLLRISPATLGRRIQVLEQDLATTLFIRHPTGYFLTDEGRALLPQAEAIEGSIRSLAAATGAGGLTGRVRVATAENIANHVLIPHLQDFRNTYPDIVLELATSVRSIGLTKREADIALRLVRPDQGRLRVRKVGAIAHALYVRRDSWHRIAAPGTDALSSFGVIGWDEEFDHLPAAVWLREHLPANRVLLTATSLATQIAAVRAGIGLALLPCFIADRDPQLQRIGDGLKPMLQDLWLIVHADVANSDRVRAVADFLVNAVRQEDSWLRGQGLAEAGDSREAALP